MIIPENILLILLDPEFLDDNYFEITPEQMASAESKELPLITETGEVIYGLASFSSVLDFDRKPKYYIAVLTDITDKKQAEKDLLLIKTVFEASQDGIAVTVDGRIILLNYSLLRMLELQIGSRPYR
ncbi:MAG: PAS domain S-box protein [Melioribacteraceae bacterium]|nr:PAS domain S-box protein [Melioribacteraceae bacterium]